MPIYSASTTGATQFDGATAATGLFDAAVSTGSPAIQVRINSIHFSGASAITSWTLSSVDPSDGQETVELTGTGTDAVIYNLGIIPTNPDGKPWQFKWVTVGKTGTALLKIDYDFVETPGA